MNPPDLSTNGGTINFFDDRTGCVATIQLFKGLLLPTFTIGEKREFRRIIIYLYQQQHLSGYSADLTKQTNHQAKRNSRKF